MSTLTILSMVAVAKVLANRASVAKVERVREQVENILHGQIAANDSSAQLTQPMLGKETSTLGSIQVLCQPLFFWGGGS